VREGKAEGRGVVLSPADQGSGERRKLPLAGSGASTAKHYLPHALGTRHNSEAMVTQPYSDSNIASEPRLNNRFWCTADMVLCQPSFWVCEMHSGPHNQISKELPYISVTATSNLVCSFDLQNVIKTHLYSQILDSFYFSED